jgi:hypothetical protein
MFSELRFVVDRLTLVGKVYHFNQSANIAKLMIDQVKLFSPIDYQDLKVVAKPDWTPLKILLG